MSMSFVHARINEEPFIHTLTIRASNMHLTYTRNVDVVKLQFSLGQFFVACLMPVLVFHRPSFIAFFVWLAISIQANGFLGQAFSISPHYISLKCHEVAFSRKFSVEITVSVTFRS